MMNSVKVLSQKEKQARNELEDLLLSFPNIDFVGVSGAPGENVVVTIGTRRPKLVADLHTQQILNLLEEKLPNLSVKVAVVRGRTS